MDWQFKTDMYFDDISHLKSTQLHRVSHCHQQEIALIALVKRLNLSVILTIAVERSITRPYCKKTVQFSAPKISLSNSCKIAFQKCIEILQKLENDFAPSVIVNDASREHKIRLLLMMTTEKNTY